jgi:hypothetical protein
MDEKKQSIQQELITVLEGRCPINLSLADLLADLFGISKDSAYRRIRCETILDIDELHQISRYFKISIDSLLGIKSNSVVFDFSTIKNVEDYKNYLRAITKDIGDLLNQKNVRIIYAAQDIPIFHNFRFEKLAKFKLFYWLRSIVNLEEFQQKKFDYRDIDDELIILGRELSNEYSRVPCEEIWTEMTPVSLFKQIEFCWSSGLFLSREQALEICDEVEQEFILLEQQAKTGIKIDSKGNPSGFKKNFNLYWCEIEIGNNCIFTQINEQKNVYLTYNTFNKITTFNQDFCNDINQWLDNLISKSTPISEVSEKHRYQFFKKIYTELNEVRVRINSD